MGALIPMSSTMYPSAPVMLDFPQLPTVNPRQWRMLQFGPYWFPGTFQERNRESKLSLIKKKLPFSYGDYNPGNTSLTGRTLEFYGSIGPGMTGAGGKILRTQADIENERLLLNGLQSLGRQSLYVGPEKFIWAYLEDFTFNYQDGTGFRVADWSAKFYCDDPRYYGSSSGPSNQGAGKNPGTCGLPNMNVITYNNIANPGSTGTTHTVNQAGNAKAFPIIVLEVLTGPLESPTFVMCSDPNHINGTGIGITFSKFNSGTPMQTGDMLVVMCDPRPESSLIAATYYPGGGWPSQNVVPVNALAFCQPGNGDLVNGIDFQYWLPWISSSTVDDGSGGLNTFSSSVTGASNVHQIQLMYWDTFI